MILTSSATEANCLLIKAITASRANTRPHIVVSAQEHPSIDLCIGNLEQQGTAAVSKVKSTHNGTIDAKQVISAIKPETVLVSVMMVNNETGINHMTCIK